MRENKLRALAVLIGVTLAAGCFFALYGQNKPREANSDGALRREAKATFDNVCASCHGLDGRGGERGPDITRPAVAQNTDSELAEVLRQGKPSRGMPAFASIGDAQIAGMVWYLRELQGRHNENLLAGDSTRGRALFFGKAKCSGCHMAEGQGGFYGSDLTSYAARKTAGEVRSAIIAPNKDRDPRDGLVTAKLADATILTGIPRNEDNFSIQLQTPDGRFHLLNKANIASLQRHGNTGMPTDYGRTLSPDELNDLVNYLLRVAGSENARKSPPGLEDGDEE